MTTTSWRSEVRATATMQRERVAGDLLISRSRSCRSNNLSAVEVNAAQLRRFPREHLIDQTDQIRVGVIAWYAGIAASTSV